MEATVVKEGTLKRVLENIKSASELGIIIPFLAIVVITSVVNPNFLSVRNFSTMLKIVPPLAITALGVSFPLMTGNVDISVGRVAGLAGMVFPYLMIVQGWGLVPALIAALLTGALVGLYNSFLIVKIGLPDFVATIGTLYIAGGARFLLTKGYPLSPLPYDLGEFGRATPLGLSWAFFAMLGFYIIATIVIKKTVFGRQLLATGDNREVAALSGINVARMRMTAYTICGFLCATAGVLLTIDLNNGVPQNGDGWEFRAIASCAVGGVSLMGGRGSAIGVMFGVLMLTVIDNSLVMMGVSASLQRSVTGIILAAAVMFDIVKQRQKVKV